MPNSKNSSIESSIKYKIIIIITFTIIGLIIRWWSAFDNLWLDEVWSVNFAGTLKNFLGALKIHHDNNHILNTIYLYYFGNGSWWPQYRIHSIIAGTATISALSWLTFLTLIGNMSPTQSI